MLDNNDIDTSKSIYLLFCTTVSRLIFVARSMIITEQNDLYKIRYGKMIAYLQDLEKQLTDFQISYCDAKKALEELFKDNEAAFNYIGTEESQLFLGEYYGRLDELKKCEDMISSKYIENKFTDVPLSYVIEILKSTLNCSKINSNIENNHSNDDEKSIIYYGNFICQIILEGVKSRVLRDVNISSTFNENGNIAI